MKILIQYRWFFLAVLILLSLAGMPYVMQAVVPNNSLTIWFLEDDPLLLEYEEFQEAFGNDEIISLMILDQNNLFSTSRLNQIRRLSEKLNRVKGISRVYSITNTNDIVIRNHSPHYELSIPEPIPSDPIKIEEIKAAVMNSDLFAGRLVNRAGTATMILLQLDVMEDIDEQRNQIISEVSHLANTDLGEGNIYLGGIGVIYSGLNEITQHDFGLFIGLSYLVMFIIVYLLFRRFMLVLLAMGSVFLATLLTLAVYGLLGYQINLLTVVLPTLIVILGVMDVLHIITEHTNPRRHKSTSPKIVENVEATLKQVFKPCFFTTLTTMAGFLSLVVSPMAILREFGAFAALGIFLALPSAFIFSAVILSLHPVKTWQRQTPRQLQTALLRQAKWLFRKPLLYWGLTGIILAVAITGINHLTVDTYTMGYLPDSHRVVRQHESIDRYWGNYFPLEFIISPHKGKDSKNSEILSAMDAFVTKVSKLEEVSSGFGLHTMVRHTINAVNAEDVDNVFDEQDRIDQVVNLMENEDPNSLRQVVTSDYMKSRLTLIGPLVSSGRLRDLMRTVEAAGDEAFEGLADISPTGYPPLYANIVEYVMRSMIRSFYLALVSILLIMILLLRNLRLALLALVPNVFPVVILIGGMGLAGVSLDIATATVAAIVLGIAIDDTIHFIVHYQRLRHAGVRNTRSILETVVRIGRALIITSCVLFTGYLVLLFASVKTVFYFGLFTAIAIIAALYGDLIILPLLLKQCDRD